MDARGDTLSDELDAMAAIGRVLEALPNEDARQRVVRWACERFGIDAVPESALLGEGMARAVPAADDPALKIDSLDDMFEVASSDDDDLVVAPVALMVPVAPVLPVMAAE